MYVVMWLPQQIFSVWSIVLYFTISRFFLHRWWDPLILDYKKYMQGCNISHKQLEIRLPNSYQIVTVHKTKIIYDPKGSRHSNLFDPVLPSILVLEHQMFQDVLWTQLVSINEYWQCTRLFVYYHTFACW